MSGWAGGVGFMGCRFCAFQKGVYAGRLVMTRYFRYSTF